MQAVSERLGETGPRFQQIRAYAKSVRNSLFQSREFRRLRSWRDYARCSRAALYAGFCGRNNLGDDIIFDAISYHLNPIQLVDATMSLPIELHMTRSICLNSGFLNHIVVGGGTLLNGSTCLAVCTDSVCRGYPVHIFGTGVRDPAFWMRHFGPKKMAHIVEKWSCVIASARHVAVRGPLSAAILNEMGVAREIDIIGDPGLSTPLVVPAIEREAGLIGLNLGSHPPSIVCSGELVELLRPSLVELMRRGYRCVFFALHPIDVKVFRGLQGQTWARGIELVELFRNRHRDVARLSACELVISQRLHGAVIAHAYGLPAVAIVYEPKVLDHMIAMGQEARAVDPKTASADELSETIWSALLHAEDERAAISARVADYRRLQAEAARRVRMSILSERS